MAGEAPRFAAVERADPDIEIARFTAIGGECQEPSVARYRRVACGSAVTRDLVDAAERTDGARKTAGPQREGSGGIQECSRACQHHYRAAPCRAGFRRSG